MLFISGASGDAGHFARAAGRLADEFTTVAYDRRGCSRSARLGDGEMMSIAAQADDAAALIVELGQAPAIVFGTSGGGNILLELIARRPRVLRARSCTSRPSSLAVATDAEVDRVRPIRELAAADPRRAMEAFLRDAHQRCDVRDARPALRERILGNGAHFFARELPAFVRYIPDAEASGRRACRSACSSGQEERRPGPGHDSFARQIELDVGRSPVTTRPISSSRRRSPRSCGPILRELA